MSKIIKDTSLIFFMSLFLLGTVYAADKVPHKVVIQVSTDDARTQKIALNLLGFYSPLLAAG